MTHDDLGHLLKQAGEGFTMSGELPRRLRRKIAVRRMAGAGILGLVLIAAGAGTVLAFSSFEGSGSSPPAQDGDNEVESDVPDIARVVCTESGARAATPEVRPQEDGIHIRIDNQTDKRAFYVRDGDLADGNHGGRLAPYSPEEVVSTFPPGRILVGCFENGNATPYSEIAGQGFAELAVVDPESIWVPAEPACPVPDRIKWETEFEGEWEAGDYEGVARMHLGLAEDDGFRPAGYPESQWKVGPSYSVIRDGRVIAIVSFPGFEPSTMWVQTCPEGGLEPGDDDEPQPVADSNSWVIYTDSEHRFSIGYPETWYRARESLTPRLGEPQEMVALATFDLVYREGDCLHMPSSALADVGSDDAFVTIQEGGGKDLEAYRARPDEFPGDAEPVEGFMCTPEQLEAYWLNFRDSGRAFYALVVLGPEAPSEVRAQAWEVLNSFEPQPTEG